MARGPIFTRVVVVASTIVVTEDCITRARVAVTRKADASPNGLAPTGRPGTEPACALPMRAGGLGPPVRLAAADVAAAAGGTDPR